MLSGSELSIAITAILIGAVCAGFLLHWAWTYLTRSRTGDSARLAEMAERLHTAETAREAAEEDRKKAEMLTARREAEITEQLAAMQSRLEGVLEGREADLARELAEVRLELETMRGGLVNARRRTGELEAQIEALQGEAG